MSPLTGIEKKARNQLVEILRNSKSTVTVQEAAGILKLSPQKAAKLMARWVTQGWMVRLRRGLYAPVPMEAKTPYAAVEDPWIIAARVFGSCYIGGWSAAEHWGMTEQIFRTVMVFTLNPTNNRKPTIHATEFWIKKIAKKQFFGKTIVWRGKEQIYVSDPAKTVVDMLDDPLAGGGAKTVKNILSHYWSEQKDKNLFLSYIKQMNNGAINKRAGYLLEKIAGPGSPLLSKLQESLTSGNAKLDPSIPCRRLITRWRLWVPESWEA